MAAADLGCDGDEAPRQALDHSFLQPRVKHVAKPLAGKEPRARKIEIEKAQNSPAGQFTGEAFESLQFAGHVAASDHGADRSAGDDIWKDAGLVQGAQHADVRPAAGRPATQRQAYFAIAHASPHAALATDRASRILPHTSTIAGRN